MCDPHTYRLLVVNRLHLVHVQIPSARLDLFGSAIVSAIFIPSLPLPLPLALPLAVSLYSSRSRNLAASKRTNLLHLVRLKHVGLDRDLEPARRVGQVDGSLDVPAGGTLGRSSSRGRGSGSSLGRGGRLAPRALGCAGGLGGLGGRGRFEGDGLQTATIASARLANAMCDEQEHHRLKQAVANARNSLSQ